MPSTRKYVGADHPVVRVGRIVGDHAVHEERSGRQITVHGHDVGGRRAAHPCDRREAGLSLVAEALNRRPPLVPGAWQRQPDGQHLRRTEAWIDGLHLLEAARQNRGRDQQYRRERDFRENQDRAHTTPAEARPTFATLSAANIPSPGLHCWRESDEDACDDAASSVKPAADHPIPISATRGRSAGPNASSAVTSMRATRRPAAPPRTPSTAASPSTCPTIRERDAPSAVRTASSRCRVVARTRKRLARLAHATSRTTTTAPRSIQSMGADLPLISSCSRATRTAVSVPCESGSIVTQPSLDRVEIVGRLRDRGARLQPCDRAQESLCAVSAP